MPIHIEEAKNTTFKTLEDFEELIKDYTHVYIYRMEQEKKGLIKELFEDNTDRLSFFFIDQILLGFRIHVIA